MIRYSHITPESKVDGPGTRTVVFLQGCTVGCKACQNQHLWPADKGREVTTEILADHVMKFGNRNITISGGEPTDQMEELALLVETLRDFGAEHIIVYTGRTFEWLVENKCFGIMNLIRQIDILVDGPFIYEMDDPMITWRGSRNQRPIDCKATVETGSLVTLDWSKPTISIDAEGNMLMPVGLAPRYGAGEAKRTRRCGQTK